LTSSVTWTSSNINATISNSAGSQGLATSTNACFSGTPTTTISASLGGITGQATLTVECSCIP
jgi:hypothetical protein